MAEAYQHIRRYREELDRIKAASGSDNELQTRRAFENCLDDYCREHSEGLTLVAEQRIAGRARPDGTATQVIPDGTVRDAMRLARGYWEAKDIRDDLDAEIRNKFNSGYPSDNIIFQNQEEAALYQDGVEAMRVDMSSEDDLHLLIKRFLDYELPQSRRLRSAQRQFNADLPSVLSNLREAVDAAQLDNAGYQAAAAEFLELCRKSISPDVGEADVREMLLQHILTKDIFLRVFTEDQFHRENNIAAQLDALERTFFTGDTRRQAIDRLRPYYSAIHIAAIGIGDYAEKQQFLKAIYENFYKAYNPAAADRLGVVYTPNEVVDFIIRGADWLLQRHFGKTLADTGVQILDPATGTGTFITNLINHLPAERLEYKYVNEIHANEVAILPYYIANLNIEYTYKEITGRYKEFPNLVFVDTLDNLDWKGVTGGAVQRQGALELGGMSAENWIRMELQNEKPISVIIGNPPYNANQQNENDNNKNREYPEIDRRISETYIAESTAQKTKQYDMYKRFIRWASDRLDDDGIIAFITNRAYIDSRQDDGFRKVVGDEFSQIYLLDLGSDVRRNPKIAGTTHNVFGIQTGVAIGFLVRDKSKAGECKIYYARRADEELAKDKLAYLQSATLDSIDFTEITPDKKHNWLNQSNPDFERLMPLVNRQTKLAKTLDQEQAVFKLYSQGVVTSRDYWVYDFDAGLLGRKVRTFINSYEETRAEYGGQDVDDALLGTAIKWSRDLKRQLRLDSPNIFDRKSIRSSLYRPFVEKPLYFNQNLNEMQYQLPSVFPNGADDENIVICFSGTSSTKPFHVLATDKLFSFDTLEKTQCLPLYRYTAEGERVCNITDWAIERVNAHYRKEWGEHFAAAVGADAIGAEDIFAYVYAVLHDPVYRHDYGVDLLREFPRLPLYRYFGDWAKMGRKLLELHLGFESIAPHPLERVEGEGAPGRALLRADRERGLIRIDERTTLAGVPADVWRYRLGSRSAVEWVLDQYRERKPRDPTVAARFNGYRFGAHKERVVELLGRVCAVSVGTMGIVDKMAMWLGDELVVFDDREQDDFALLSLSQWFGEPEDEEWLAQWSEM